MKIYKYSKQFGFQMSIPDDWPDSLMVDLIDHLSQTNNTFSSSSGKRSDSNTIVGSNSKYLHMLITPLLENEPEPAISQTREYFDGLTNRQNLNIIATGTISVANKEHFWASYYRGFLLSVAAGGQFQFFKKYCLYLNRTEYLFTAGLYFVNPGEKFPTVQDLGDSEKIFDEMVSSIKLLNCGNN
jgi:hypothetical protein